jgi:hypothetical protein
MVRFRVDEVKSATERLPTRALEDLVPEAIAVADPAQRVIWPTGTHALLGAVGKAFAEHRPLVLSPDAVWLTIAQGVAQHVRLNAERLRSRLVRHEGKKRLTIGLDGPMPTDAASWRAAVQTFRGKLAEEIGDGRARLFECDFTTSSEIDKLASQIVLLDAYSPYFSLWMSCVCGIPEITLTGVVDDWRKIRERIDVVAELDLEPWCKSLRPIADHFVRAASGDADVKFWRRIYNPVDAYGGSRITGWAARFYPYLKVGGVVREPNPLLALPIDEPKDKPGKGPFYSGPGISSDSVPDTVSHVNVHVVDLVAKEHRVVALHGGVVAIAQDDDGALRPIAGWHLAKAKLDISEVIDRIVREHPVVENRDARFTDGPADLVALRHRIASGTLFEGAWRISPAPTEVATLGKVTVDAVFELRDGRTICCASHFITGNTHWIACRLEPPKEGNTIIGRRILDDPALIPMFGTSLATFLEGALESNGEIDHMAVDRFYSIVPTELWRSQR